MQHDNILEIAGLNQSYGESATLRNLSLGLQAGERLALIGRNGVGKTTLLQCIMGQLPIRSGSIQFEGEDLAALSTPARVRNGIACVPQGRHVFADLSVQENLETGLGVLPRGHRQLPALVFELFPVLADMRQRRGGDLSGGQQQQLAIARALVTEPRLLLLDEPTEGIQPSVVQSISSTLTRLNGEFGLTLFIVEQKLSFVRRLATRYAVMNRGSLVDAGPMSALDDEVVKTYLTV